MIQEDIHVAILAEAYSSDIDPLLNNHKYFCYIKSDRNFQERNIGVLMIIKRGL